MGLSRFDGQVVFSGGLPAEHERGSPGSLGFDDGCRGGLLAAHQLDGREQWSVEFPGTSCRFFVGPVLHDPMGNVIAAGFAPSGYLDDVGAFLGSWTSTGEERWVRALPAGLSAEALSLYGNRLAVAGVVGEGEQAGAHLLLLDSEGNLLRKRHYPRVFSFSDGTRFRLQLGSAHATVIWPTGRSLTRVRLGEEDFGQPLWHYRAPRTKRTLGIVLPRGSEFKAMGAIGDDVMIVGSVNGPVDFGGGVRKPKGRVGSFVVVLDEQGEYLDDLILPGLGIENLTIAGPREAIAVDAADSIHRIRW